MSRNNSIVGSIIGLIFFLGFGVFFFVGLSPFTFISIMPFFPMIFIIVIIGIVGAVSARSRRTTCCSPKSNNQYQYNTPKISRSNPYLVNTSSSYTVRPIYIEDAEPEKPIPNFCQYCGTRKDKNATYCHSCGSKL